MSADSYQLNPHQWVSTYADYLYIFAIRRISDEELAKDLVQETFLAALEKAANFEGKSSERTWLTAILKNKIIDIYRKQSSLMAKEIKKNDLELEPDFFQPEGNWQVRHQPQHFGIEETDPLNDKEFDSTLQLCLSKLPSLWIAVFTMKHVDGEDTSLICTELKVSQSNFWVIIHRAKLNLRTCLQKNWI